MKGWEMIFSQSRVQQRAVAHALAMPCVLGRRTISRTLCALGRANQDWSADYKMFSRSRWDADSLFSPVLDGYLMRYPEGTIAVAIDDTKLAKTGKKKVRKNVVKGIAHIKASFNNTQVTITELLDQ